MADDFSESLLGRVTPGMHAMARQQIKDHFSTAQVRIIDRWKSEWYVSRAGEIRVGNSPYQFCIVKPTSTYQETLGLLKEIVIILSEYDNFDARILETYDAVSKLINHETRIERICYVLISRFTNIQKSLAEFLSSQESQIVVPFTYDDFETQNYDSHLIRNRFRSCFHSRDLFDFSDALKNDFFYFGRSDIATEIISRHRSHLNTGVFGLRKSGKTSIIYDVIRKLPHDETMGVFIDCQNPSFNMKRWNQALFYIVKCAAETAHIVFPELSGDKFTIDDASDLFLDYLKKIHTQTNRTILLLFDEIEKITFGKSPVSHWREDRDSVHFWEGIRSSFQHTTSNVFTFCLFGTNPKCIEYRKILGSDNPICNAFTPKYITGFQLDQTREMVKKLGRLMGLKFEQEIYTHLNEDYGGHPFLIRQVCSSIAQLYPQRPVTIDRIKYANGKKHFNEGPNRFGMLLDVLEEFYSDEYEMLLLLAKGDVENFNFYAYADPDLTKHLLGYGIIRKIDGVYDFRIDSIKDYLLAKTSKLELAKRPEDKWQAICLARNNIESSLRTMVRDILRTAHAPVSEAKEYIVGKLHSGKPKYATYSYNDLFDSKKSLIFLKNLQTLILSDWKYFSDYFEPQDLFCRSMDILNNEGRFDAHASIPTDAEMGVIQSAVDLIKKGIDKYNDE